MGRRIARIAGAIAALGALAWACRGIDAARALALVARSGPWIALGLAPYAMAVAIDALGWRALVGSIAKVRWSLLARVRLRVDSFGATLPGGSIVAESLAPAWMSGAMPIDAGVAAIAWSLVGYATLATFSKRYSSAKDTSVTWTS